MSKLNRELKIAAMNMRRINNTKKRVRDIRKKYARMALKK